jgi:cation:H+ antiporter
MLIQIVTFLAGLVLLLAGGRLLVNASIDTARRLGVPPLIVGLTLVAWGTSAPELALNLVSASRGRGDLALGNVVGASICNMALVLGVCALLRALLIEERLVRVEIRLNAVVLATMALAGIAFGLPPWLAGVMLGVFWIYSLWTVVAALRHAGPRPDFSASGDADAAPPMGWPAIAALFAVGLVLLSAGGSLASDAASAIAVSLGVPAAIVGVTIVSIGTTLPELMTGALAVLKGRTDLAMGNAIGSCLFNVGAIYGVTGLISPPEIGRDFLVPLAYMGILALVLVPISRTASHRVSRVEGALLLASYAGFLAWSAFDALGE